ncbi:MAG: protein phosphatase 2C domain-containing protein [Lachnospiraceae bacterium]|nr:protein phosphatase 2C domain-containing protein [Lachnospiraceae bacterium]
MILDHYSFTGPGGRSVNEDSIGTALRFDKGIFVVADGLGGHKDGELASKCVVETLLGEHESLHTDDRRTWLKDALASANSYILKLQQDMKSIMKSTAVVLCVDNDMACWAHVGDSRLYFIHDRRIEYITPDHSVAYKKYAAGEISRFQINTDEDQATLLRSLGSPDRNEASICSEPVRLSLNDAFLLCSDGVWEYLHDEEVLVDYLKAEDAKDWGEKLLLRVIDRVDGTNDNLSLITIMAGQV